jgi:hypothetical protein
MYIGDKGLAQVSRVAPLEFKASLFPKNVTCFSPVGDPNFGHSLLYFDSLYVRTHLFCIGQNFPLLYFYKREGDEDINTRART